MPPWNQWKWEEQQDDERWTLPSSGKTRSSRKWDWPSTPTEKSSTWYPQDNRDWQSPTGQGQETFSKDGLPNEFKPSREFLDSREVFGKTLKEGSLDGLEFQILLGREGSPEHKVSGHDLERISQSSLEVPFPRPLFKFGCC